MRERARVVLAVAREPTLARMELAYLGFNMAEAAQWVAILVWAFNIGGAGTAGLVALVMLLPAGILAPFTAYAGDRFRRDRVLLAAYALLAVTLGATAVALYTNAPAPITVLAAALAAIAFSLVRPVQAAIVPAITHTPADLTAANAVEGIIESVGLFLGPLISGILLFRSEPGDTFAVFAVVCVVAALLVLGLPVEGGRVAPPPESARKILTGAFGGFSVVRKDRRVLSIVGLLALATFVSGALEILFVATAIDFFGAGESWAGFLYAASGLGAIVGAVVSVTLVGRRRLTPAIAVSGAVMGVPIAAVGQIPVLAVAPVLIGVSGAGSTVNYMAGRTLLQRVAPEATLGRVFGVLEGLTLFASAFGSAAGGVLVESLGVSSALVVVGGLVPIAIAIVWRGLSALDRDARAPDPEALELLRRLPIFAPLSAPTMERILAELTWLEVPKGATLIRQGEPGDRFYVIAHGSVSVSRDDVVVREQGPGEYVGDIALLHDVPRTATVVALEHTRVIAIERERFLAAVTGHSQSRERAEAVVTERLAEDAAPGG